MPLFGLLKKNGPTAPGATVQFNKKKLAKGTTRWGLRQSLKKSLGTGQMMKEAVKCPPGEDPSEWVAMNTMEIYNNTHLVYGFVSEFCTPKSCPEMSAGTPVTVESLPAS
eukprot:TRINITY_DN1608_c0_g1_i3.p3 TRINITY_DN1608_c0_g1~~TRINITY_DN1608_c0_g1_i3.p3  ORF type:complete len:110 (-),score=9.74 TRINITY_DN1608_c0_g1_i3:589-918(-)